MSVIGNLRARLNNFTPNMGTAQLLWTVGGWIIIFFILGNTIYATSLAIAQLRDITQSTALEMSDLRGEARNGDNLTTAEKRQMLATAKAYVMTHDAPDTDFSLVFIKRSGDWALVEVVSAVEGTEGVKVLMQKKDARWTAVAMGTEFPDWSSQAPGLFD
ncbi:MAG TPA: hypothetical protein VMC43_00130 [Candidatus Paceibacterota bacterium]|nr:hypothetical protein [Candidatus Paceibacterota bacterium]